MRVIQLIDSLDAGGAERMAVNYANALAGKIDFSGLVVTRKEGALLSQIDSAVPYLFLSKKSIFDVKSLLLLRNFVIKNKVEIAHTHGTSFFTAFLLKISYPKIKIIWHEHYGARVNQNRKQNLILFFTSFFFSSVFVVNHQLKFWVRKNLLVKKVFYIPNFATIDTSQDRKTILYGSDGKRIVCVANLKSPKNHLMLIRAFKALNLFDLGWSLHLIGKDYKDFYSDNLKKFISSSFLQNAVFIYDSKNDIQNILSQSTIGLLCSTNEGFPVSLLEYGLAKLAVVSTNVGYCSEIIIDNFSGLLFDPLNIEELQNQLYRIVSNKVEREQYAKQLHQLIIENYSIDKGIEILLSKYDRQ